MAPDNQITELTMDAGNLYRDEVFTDQRAGTIRRLTPVTPDDTIDTTRKVLYVGQAQVLTPMGAVPLSFEIDASSLQGAIDGFAAAAKLAVENAARELEELRREAASQIVVPKPGQGSFGTPGGPGGGRIQMP